jgi:hypothetical protein
MIAPASLRKRQCAVLLACALSLDNSGAATAVGGASATVLPSTLSASVALYVRTAPLCSGGCAARQPEPSQWPPAAARTPLVSMEGGVAQFTMFGETASNYVVRLDAAARGAWPGRMDSPILLEPTLTPAGRLAIVITLAPATTSADAFQVVINYN